MLMQGISAEPISMLDATARSQISEQTDGWMAFGSVFASKLHIEFNTADKRCTLFTIFARPFVHMSQVKIIDFCSDGADGDGCIVKINDNERCLDNEMHTHADMCAERNAQGPAQAHSHVSIVCVWSVRRTMYYNVLELSE